MKTEVRIDRSTVEALAKDSVPEGSLLLGAFFAPDGTLALQFESPVPVEPVITPKSAAKVAAPVVPYTPSMLHAHARLAGRIRKVGAPSVPGGPAPTPSPEPEPTPIPEPTPGGGKGQGGGKGKPK